MSFKISPTSGFYALGIFCFGLGTQHALFEGRGLETVLESFIVWSLSALVFFTAYTLSDRDISLDGRWRALVLSLGVTAAFVLLAVAVWLTWAIRGPSRELSFLVSFAGALGAAVGTRSGLYAVEGNERLKRAQELSKLLKINQRVLRHNIRNELSIALGLLEDLETADSTEEIPETTRIIRRHLDDLLEATDRTRRIVSIWETDARREFDLVEAVHAEVTAIREDHPEITLTTELPETCRVRAHPALSLAIEEAILNAVEHNAPDVTVTVSIHTRDDGTVITEIADTGQGISEDDWRPIELPEETPLSHTEGLGLWIIYWTATMSGGSVEFAENEPRGTIVRLLLPPDRSVLSMFSDASRNR
ncbi:sensor histidine kinase [Halopenitus persicus]|uniref:histidine kinase n=1 Tax=Halopenitus persicus TaxID=1048396 RepID=A0A1H3ECF8_9EURY|nr:HAMP domain-containing sensor histidine kinase [Halopenitus persicus]QHS17507.1 HAMP domain-containing histidine kinase [haloarchaeon 3A1-DGR]SDX76423.1 Signal transduction histidine kinase [Halopenitus persicus]